MTNWLKYLTEEPVLYFDLDEIPAEIIIGYVRTSIEARLRLNKQLIHGTMQVYDLETMKSTSLVQLVYVTDEGEKSQYVYSSLFDIEAKDEGKVEVTSFVTTLDEAIGKYCTTLTQKYGVPINFKSQAQSSENHHLS